MRHCSSRTVVVRAALALAALATFLAGCSDLYLDRRETVALAADDAVASDRIVQTIDPWPAAANNKSDVYNGDKMRGAAARYRTGKIIEPQPIDTSDAWGAQQQTQSGGADDSDIASAKSAK
jgi:hypothetical protein